MGDKKAIFCIVRENFTYDEVLGGTKVDKRWLLDYEKDDAFWFIERDNGDMELCADYCHLYNKPWIWKKEYFDKCFRIYDPAQSDKNDLHYFLYMGVNSCSWCGSNKTKMIGHYRSPEEDWKALAGREGYIMKCERCHHEWTDDFIVS